MLNRRVLIVDPAERRWRLETLRVDSLTHNPQENYWILSGEPLCQYLLRRDPAALVMARGPLPFISGNKASVGYVSPLTGLPHYSFVGGRAAAMLFNLGLDAICFSAGNPISETSRPALSYMAISGRAPNLQVEFKDATGLPLGQRSAFYWLVERELGGDPHRGSVFTLGEGAYLGYLSANLAAEAIYHAGRGGAGHVFAHGLSALVLRAEPVGLSEFFGGSEAAFARNPNALIAPLLSTHCARMSSRTGGTIAKLYATGANSSGQNTLPAFNARRLGYALANLGSGAVLKATRQGQTGCHWCQVDCRHWHWVPADYAPGGRDIFLDDFEPTFAIFAMLGLAPHQGTLQATLDLVAEVDRRLILPIEQMGCDIINIGIGLSALFEGIEQGLIPARDVPEGIVRAGGLNDSVTSSRQRLEAAVEAIRMLRHGQADAYPALRAIGDGPQALAERYPSVQDIVFTSGRGTLGNAGHCNALWTFLMPFSRFFGHYVGQYYKVDDVLPPSGSDRAAYQACFQRVIARLLAREFFWVLSNALSQCAFTFVIFSQEGEGERLSDDDLLVRLLREYGVHTTRSDLEWFAQAFWAQSVDLKCRFGWRAPSASDFPRRIYEALSQTSGHSPDELVFLMDLLIAEWKRQARQVMARFGYGVAW